MGHFTRIQNNARAVCSYFEATCKFILLIFKKGRNRFCESTERPRNNIVQF